MVKMFLVFFFFMNIVSSVIAEEKRIYDGNMLKKRIKEGSDYRQSAADRMKATKADRDSLKVISPHDIKYQLPNGEFVTGILLPNGRKAPAIESKFGLRPACITRDFTLVMGVWNDQDQAIQCEIPAEELAVLELDGEKRTQVGTTNEENETKNFVNKYASTSVGRTDSDAREHHKSDSYINTDNKIDSVKNKAETSQATKYAGGNSLNKTSTAPSSNVNNSNNSNTQRSQQSDVYYPPNVRGSASSTGGALKIDKNKFGIPVGTWIEAELSRTATSAETGQIEITLLENVNGRFQLLPAGTMLFAEKYFNVANRRLEAKTVHGVTPEGFEITNIEAFVYSLDQTAGLSGTIVRDREGEVLSAGTNTLLKTAARTVPGTGGLAASAASDFTEEMLKNEQNYAPETPDAVITVSPQRILLKIAKTF